MTLDVKRLFKTRSILIIHSESCSKMAAPSNQLTKLDQEIMESIGWNENAFAPIASDDNKLLMNAIRLLQEDKLRKSSHLEQLGGRVVWLKQHVENNHDDIQRNLVRI